MYLIIQFKAKNVRLRPKTYAFSLNMYQGPAKERQFCSFVFHQIQNMASSEIFENIAS